jgi:hypothetical protein
MIIGKIGVGEVSKVIGRLAFIRWAYENPW